MTPGLLIGLFVFIMAAVSALGYVFVLRPSRAEGGETEIPAQLGRSEMPMAQAAVADLFRMIGEAMPGSQSRAEGVRHVHTGVSSGGLPRTERKPGRSRLR